MVVAVMAQIPGAKEVPLSWQWTVGPFHSLPERMYSPLFGVPGAPWRLLLFPSGNNAQQHAQGAGPLGRPVHISLYLDAPKVHTVLTRPTQACTFEVLLVHPTDPAKTLRKSTSHVFIHSEWDWGYTALCEVAVLQQEGFLSPDGMLTIRIEGTSQIAPQEFATLENLVTVPVNSAALMLAPMYGSQLWCDLTLCAVPSAPSPHHSPDDVPAIPNQHAKQRVQGQHTAEHGTAEQHTLTRTVAESAHTLAAQPTAIRGTQMEGGAVPELLSGRHLELDRGTTTAAEPREQQGTVTRSWSRSSSGLGSGPGPAGLRSRSGSAPRPGPGPGSESGLSKGSSHPRGVSFPAPAPQKAVGPPPWPQPERGSMGWELMLRLTGNSGTADTPTVPVPPTLTEGPNHPGVPENGGDQEVVVRAEAPTGPGGPAHGALPPTSHINGAAGTARAAGEAVTTAGTGSAGGTGQAGAAPSLNSCAGSGANARTDCAPGALPVLNKGAEAEGLSRQATQAGPRPASRSESGRLSHAQLAPGVNHTGHAFSIGLASPTISRAPGSVASRARGLTISGALGQSFGGGAAQTAEEANAQALSQDRPRGHASSLMRTRGPPASPVCLSGPGGSCTGRPSTNHARALSNQPLHRTSESGTMPVPSPSPAVLRSRDSSVSRASSPAGQLHFVCHSRDFSEGGSTGWYPDLPLLTTTGQLGEEHFRNVGTEPHQRWGEHSRRASTDSLGTSHSLALTEFAGPRGSGASGHGRRRSWWAPLTAGAAAPGAATQGATTRLVTGGGRLGRSSLGVTGPDLGWGGLGGADGADGGKQEVKLDGKADRYVTQAHQAEVDGPRTTLPAGMGLGRGLRKESGVGEALPAGAVSFPCHRVVVGAASPGLRAMLTSSMVEGAGGRVMLRDTAPEVLRLLLIWAYGGEVAAPAAWLVRLWALADMYGVTRLCTSIETALTVLLDAQPQLALDLYANVRQHLPHHCTLCQAVCESIERHLPLSASQPQFLELPWRHVLHALAVAWDRYTDSEHELVAWQVPHDLLTVLSGVQAWLQAHGSMPPNAAAPMPVSAVLLAASASSNDTCRAAEGSDPLHSDDLSRGTLMGYEGIFIGDQTSGVSSGSSVGQNQAVAGSSRNLTGAAQSAARLAALSTRHARRLSQVAQVLDMSALSHRLARWVAPHPLVQLAEQWIAEGHSLASTGSESDSTSASANHSDGSVVERGRPQNGREQQSSRGSKAKKSCGRASAAAGPALEAVAGPSRMLPPPDRPAGALRLAEDTLPERPSPVMQAQPAPMQAQPAPVQPHQGPMRAQLGPMQEQPAPLQGQLVPMQAQPAPIQGHLGPMQAQPAPMQGHLGPMLSVSGRTDAHMHPSRVPAQRTTTHSSTVHAQPPVPHLHLVGRDRPPSTAHVPGLPSHARPTRLEGERPAQSQPATHRLHAVRSVHASAVNEMHTGPHPAVHTGQCPPRQSRYNSQTTTAPTHALGTSPICVPGQQPRHYSPTRPAGVVAGVAGANCGPATRVAESRVTAPASATHANHAVSGQGHAAVSQGPLPSLARLSRVSTRGGGMVVAYRPLEHGACGRRG